MHWCVEESVTKVSAVVHAALIEVRSTLTNKH